MLEVRLGANRESLWWLIAHRILVETFRPSLTCYVHMVLHLVTPCLVSWRTTSYLLSHRLYWLLQPSYGITPYTSLRCRPEGLNYNSHGAALNNLTVVVLLLHSVTRPSSQSHSSKQVNSILHCHPNSLGSPFWFTHSSNTPINHIFIYPVKVNTFLPCIHYIFHEIHDASYFNIQYVILLFVQS